MFIYKTNTPLSDSFITRRKRFSKEIFRLTFFVLKYESLSSINELDKLKWEAGIKPRHFLFKSKQQNLINGVINLYKSKFIARINLFVR